MDPKIIPDWPRGITFQQVWSALMEDREEMKQLRETQKEYQKEAAEQHKETERFIKEVAAQQKEADERWRNEAEERQKEDKERKRELDQIFRKTEREIERTTKQMGGLHNSFGDLAEHLVAPGIVKRFNKLGYHFDEVSSGRREILDEKGKVLTEIDLMLENGEFIIAVEVKSEPKAKDIEHHIGRIEILRKHRNKKGDTRIIRGAIAGVDFTPLGLHG